MSTALPVIDELGDDPMTRQEASLFFRLVSYRYGRGEELGPVARLLRRSHVLNIKGRSYRLRDLEEASLLSRPDLTSPAWGTEHGAPP